MKSIFCRILVSLPVMLLCLSVSAQADRHDVRRGNRQFSKGNWADSDVSYRKALLKDSLSYAANYNLANALFREKNMDEAGRYVSKAMEAAGSDKEIGDAAFNAGDVAIAKKDWQTAVDALKKAMLADPEDMEAKENYAYAKKMLENQGGQGGQGGNQDQNQNQDQEQNQDQDQNQDKERNKDQDQNQNQDKERNKDQDQNREDGNNKDSDGQGDGQRRQDEGISPQQAQQMLRAMQSKEKETMDKVNKEKAALLKSRQKEKNW